jgi:hypothetical protein
VKKIQIKRNNQTHQLINIEGANLVDFDKAVEVIQNFSNRSNNFNRFFFKGFSRNLYFARQ